MERAISAGIFNDQVASDGKSSKQGAVFMNATILLTLTAPLSVAVCSGTATDGSEARERQLWFENSEERNAAARAIRAHRARVVSQCGQIVLTMAGNEARKETVRTAIELLGDLRFVEAVPLLVDNLTFRVDVWSGSPRRYLRQFPSAESLIEIGVPSIEPVVRRAQESDEELVLTLCWVVVHRVLGRGMGVAYLKDLTAQQRDPLKRARLKRLQEAMEKGQSPAPLPSPEE